MTRKFLPRLLASAVILIALVAAVTTFAGSSSAQGSAQGSAAQANYAPRNTAPPTIAGTAAVGQTLTATAGTWTSDTSPSFSYQWQHCDANGNTCAALAGATATTYVAQSSDVGQTLRVVVTATNPSGSSSATSAQTTAVTQPGPEGAIKLPNGQTSIPASSMALPARLIVDSVKFQPSILNSRSSFTMRVHVTDTRAYVVRDVLVYTLGLPYGWTRNSSEVRTGQDGWATLTMTPTQNMPVSPGHALVLFVRARVEGQDLLAGSSTRRLVQVRIR